MTKKDYELFANEIHKKADKGLPFTDMMETCVDIFASDNPLFQAEKFRTACMEGKHIRQSIKG
jgi:hypothetical protein